MIETFESELGQTVKMTELYDYLGLDRSQYSRFVRKEIIESLHFDDGKDYSTSVSNNTNIGKRGQFRKEINIHIDTAKKLCMISKSEKGNEIRNELVQLTKQKESGRLLNHEQILWVMKMVKIFAVYEHRKIVLNNNAEIYVKNALTLKPGYYKNKNILYAKFHQWRNEVLNTGKDVLAQRVKEYCLIERKRIPAKFTQDEALTLMGEYEQIKNAMWDLLSSQNKSEEVINNVCSLASEMAKEMKPFLERLNESNLFFDKIDNSDIKQLMSQ